MYSDRRGPDRIWHAGVVARVGGGGAREGEGGAGTVAGDADAAGGVVVDHAVAVIPYKRRSMKVTVVGALDIISMCHMAAEALFYS